MLSRLFFPLVAALLTTGGASGAEVGDDPSRPRFHYTPKRGGMIDVWGGARYRDSWRLFYDLNVRELDVNGGYKLGGSFFQLKTKDFVHWEEVGVALDPDRAHGECHLNDGNVIVRGDGTPLVYYTSIKADPKRPNEHVPLVCDGEMRHFTRLDEGRITVDNHGGPKYDGKGWSDVWMFREAGRRFMIISKCVREDDGRDEIPIYEATDETWLRWRYLGTFLEKSGEVVNFAKVGGKWILVFSPYGNPVYHVGDFDAATGKFTPLKSGVLSYGYSNQGGGGAPHLAARGFYATTFLPREDGRQVITAWIGGFICPDGWNGAVALPRDLTLDDDLTPRMWPVKEFETLRGRSVEIENLKEMPSFGGSFDLELEFKGWAYVRVGKSLSVCSTGWQTSVNGTKVPLPPGEFPNRLRVVADVSTVEVFVNGGRASATRTISMIRPDDTVRVEVIADAEAGETVSRLKGRMHEILPVRR